MIETVQNSHCSQRTFAGKVSIQTLTWRISTFWRNEEKEGVWVCSVQQTNYWLVETSFCIHSSFIQKHSARWRRFSQVDETVCGRRTLDVSFSEKACFKLQVTKSNAQNFSAVFLCGVGIKLSKNISLWWVHSGKLFQQSAADAKTKWCELKFQCNCWDNDTTSE